MDVKNIAPRKYGSKTVRTKRGTFAPGNPGKPIGARHRSTIAAESLFDGDAERLTRKAIEMALGGDTIALRLCIDRIAPPRRDRHVVFPLPAIEKASDAVKAFGAIISAVSRGGLTPSEALSLSNLIDCFTRAVEASDFDARLSVLEKTRAPNAPGTV